MRGNAARRLIVATVVGVLLAGTAAAGEVQGRNETAASRPSAESTDIASALFTQPAPQPLFGAESEPSQRLASALPPKRAAGAPALRRGLIISFGALQVLDAHSTLRALDAGAREANPAMAAIAKNRTALFAVKAGTTAATAYVIERLGKKHPRRALVVAGVLNAAYAALVAHNYRVARNP